MIDSCGDCNSTVTAIINATGIQSELLGKAWWKSKYQVFGTGLFRHIKGNILSELEDDLWVGSCGYVTKIWMLIHRKIIYSTGAAKKRLLLFRLLLYELLRSGYKDDHHIEWELVILTTRPKYLSDIREFIHRQRVRGEFRSRVMSRKVYSRNAWQQSILVAN